MRRGIDAPNAERSLRKAFVLAAQRKARATSSRVTQSLIASMVGISRVEARILMRDSSVTRARQYTRVEQVLFGWRTDPRFVDVRGRPKQLLLRGAKNSFEELARKYGRDITPRALLDEMARRGVVRSTKEFVALTKPASSSTREALSAQYDLKFLVAQLSAYDFSKGRRAFTSRRTVVTARSKKDASVLRQLALGRIETILSSLAEISAEKTSRESLPKKGLRKIQVSAVVAVDAEDSKS